MVQDKVDGLSVSFVYSSRRDSKDLDPDSLFLHLLMKSNQEGDSLLPLLYGGGRSWDQGKDLTIRNRQVERETDC